MLVFKRKQDESVCITIPGSLTADGQPIEIRVKVGSVGPSWTKLCFDAPRSVLITRHELLHPEEVAA